jgi:transposase
VIKIVPFEPWHAEAILFGLPQNRFKDKLIAAYLSPGSIARSLMRDDLYGISPLACGGIINLEFQRGEAWLLCSPRAQFRKFSLWKAVKHCLPELARLGYFRRVQATCYERDKGKFFEKLGFHCETKEEIRMLFYGPNGESADLYSRIFQ